MAERVGFEPAQARRSVAALGGAGRREALAQSFPWTSLLYIRQIVESQDFSIFQLEDDAGTDVSPPCPQALQLPGLNGKRDLLNLGRTDRDRGICCSPAVDIHAR